MNLIAPMRAQEVIAEGGYVSRAFLRWLAQLLALNTGIANGQLITGIVCVADTNKVVVHTLERVPRGVMFVNQTYLTGQDRGVISKTVDNVTIKALLGETLDLWVF